MRKISPDGSIYISYYEMLTAIDGLENSVKLFIDQPGIVDSLSDLNLFCYRRCYLVKMNWLQLSIRVVRTFLS